MDQPLITVDLPEGRTYSMWVRHLQLRWQISSYRRGFDKRGEPAWAMQFASQWVCSCGARGNLEQYRLVPEGELIAKDFEKWPMIARWVVHARKQHCLTQLQSRRLRDKVHSLYLKEVKYASGF